MRVAVLLTMGLLIGCTGHAVHRSPGGGLRKTFARCPGAESLSKAADVSWAVQNSRLVDHEALRRHLNVPMPAGTARVLFWSSGAHHTAVRFSVVATRDGQGRWHTNGVGEETSGLLNIAPHPWGSLDRTLTAQQGLVLDGLLADPCLYASPRYQRNSGIVAGGAEQTLEIETPEHRWIASWFGIRTPQEEAVVTAIAE